MDGRCENCDALRPSAAGYAYYPNGTWEHPDGSPAPGGCECDVCVSTCWAARGMWCEAVDWRERALAAEAKAERVTRERDAYRRAKAENDERFMRERDEAREEAERLRAAVGRVLSDHGCDCDCGHDAEGHDADCDKCLGCRVEAAMERRR